MMADENIQNTGGSGAAPGDESRRPADNRDNRDNRDYRGGGRDNRDNRDNRDSRDSRDGRPYRGGGGGGRRPFFKKKVCRFCTQDIVADYKNYDMLRRFVTDRGKILPRRITGTCAKHQRALSTEIKRARVLAYLPFVKK